MEITKEDIDGLIYILKFTAGLGTGFIIFILTLYFSFWWSNKVDEWREKIRKRKKKSSPKLIEEDLEV